MPPAFYRHMDGGTAVVVDRLRYLDDFDRHDRRRYMGL